MRGGSTHADVEYVVDSDGAQRAHRKFQDALAYAFSTALVAGRVHLDVLVYSEEGAAAFGGDEAIQEYRDDPEASVFRRFEIEVSDLGRVA